MPQGKLGNNRAAEVERVCGEMAYLYKYGAGLGNKRAEVLLFFHA
jgi:hypothetical protein